MKRFRKFCAGLIVLVSLSVFTILLVCSHNRIPLKDRSILHDKEGSSVHTSDVTLMDIDAYYVGDRILLTVDSGAKSIVGLAKSDLNNSTPTASWVRYSPVDQGHQTCNVRIDAWQVNAELDSLQVSLSGRIDDWGRERAEEILKLFFDTALLSNHLRLGTEDNSFYRDIENSIWRARWNPGVKTSILQIERK